ncbi:MAG: type II toxin-antitoxin system HicA family toxin [Polyangia bacterium]
MRPREVGAMLERLDFAELRQRGSHRQYRHPDAGRPSDRLRPTIDERPGVQRRPPAAAVRCHTLFGGGFNPAVMMNA